MIMAGSIAWCAAAFVIAAVLTHRLVGWAWQRGMIDRPHQRRIHMRATPRGGGLAIIAVAGMAALIAAWQLPAQPGRLAAAMLPAAAVALVGWCDDIAPRPMLVRLAAQVLAAAVVVGVAGPVSSVECGMWGRCDLGGMAAAASILWLVGLTNVFNFLDGSDGLAGLAGAVVAGCLAAAADGVGEPALAALAAAVAAACLGFLTCNWEPARIFMGDVGSTGCGFLLAALPLAAAPAHSPRLVPVVAAAAAPLILDAAVTLLVRLRHRENIFMPHRQHLYQRLVLAGWSHQAVAVIYGGLAAAGGLIAISWMGGPR
jgi:UDP-N-acetylmuramyl pentapeptide phosphotransferase/UDP-N-acetylglucosamine-1-phosphate transferase